jgi:hypothetical protein
MDIFWHYVKIALETVGIIGLVFVVAAVVLVIVAVLYLAYEQAQGRNPFQ